MAKKPELIEQAKTLGINTEGLTVDQLKAAIKLHNLTEEAKSLEITTEGLNEEQLETAISEKKTELELNELIEKAKTLEIETEGLDAEALKVAISEKETVEEKIELNPTQLRQLKAKELRAANKKKLDTDAKAQETKEAEQKSAAETAKAVKDTRPTYEDERGLKFRFKKSTPKTLNIDGKTRKISELIKDDEVMLELVNGNSNQIEQLY